ncbi:GNAT family N-acetyltransferase [Leptobacterium flavescens]|uniref:GNAT family N-acetyltransferase n=1 Tax=Leptobacterium flavescens TaxID=472055 RepID=UPI00293BA2CB|nr:N-acetyltransferase family protein [Leptobacterium flavescens]
MNYRDLTEKDWSEVAKIYKEGIDTGDATFELEIPSWTDWNNGHLKECRIIAENDNGIAGWAALSPVSGRCVYGGVAEVSVYIAADFYGQKIGTKLLEKLIDQSERNGIWTLQAGIFPENKASLRIHEKLGFRTVGYREKIGKMNGVWRDTVLLERRSKKTGLE